MKWVILLLPGLLLALAGCAKPPEEVYSHPKTGKAQLTTHVGECNELADKFGVINMSPVHQYPMDDMKDHFQRDRVFRFCMAKKGYERDGYTPVTVNETNTRIHVNDPVLSAGETTPVTISFVSPVGGLEYSDLTVENGTLSQLRTSDSGRTWTAVLTAASGVEAPDNVIRLDNSGVINGLTNKGSGVTVSNPYAIHGRQMLSAVVEALP